MTIAERIDYLVRELAYDNAKVFASRCGLPITSLSKWRHGDRVPRLENLDKMVEAYPEIRSQWLFYGKGQPFWGVPTNTAVELKERVEKLEKMVGEMMRELEKYRK